MHFNSTNGQVTDSHKHLGLVVDSNLNFNEHVDSKITKCNKIIGLMKKRSQFLSRKSLLTIYKSFVRPNLNYADTQILRRFYADFTQIYFTAYH